MFLSPAALWCALQLIAAALPLTNSSKCNNNTPAVILGQYVQCTLPGESLYCVDTAPAGFVFLKVVALVCHALLSVPATVLPVYSNPLHAPVLLEITVFAIGPVC